MAVSLVSDAVPIVSKHSSFRRWFALIGRLFGVTVVLATLGLTTIATYYYTQHYLSVPHPTSHGTTACAAYQGQVMCLGFGSSHVTVTTLPNKNTYLVLAVLFGLMAASSLAGLIKLLYNFGVLRRRRRVIS